ncbi:MucR family transcriptional regulator [Micromonospora sp. NPDC048999]|uniref:MucR family transcriptional regulator n=1 Tax=Micromonospora sp. NPDC048999 TaxID=3155391 RepID=UPI0033F6C124
MTDHGRTLPPEVQWRTEDSIRCLECGRWMRALGRHLPATHGMTAAEYREAWGMRQRQPLAAGYLSEVRREIAVATGGPDRLRELAPKVAPLAAAGRVGRERREQERRALHRAQDAAAARSSAQADSRAAIAAWRLGDQDVGAYLRRRYVVDEQPMRVLIAELGVSKEVIRRLMDTHGVERRGPGPLPT